MRDGASSPAALDRSASPGHPAAESYDRNWRVLVGAAVSTFSGQPSVAYYTFGVFLSEIIAATHWRASAIASAIGPGALMAALVSPLIGMASDRLGVRMVTMVGAPLFVAGFAFIGLFPTGPVSFGFASVVMWLLIFAGSPVPYAQMLAGWFDRRRGVALAVMFAAGSIGIALWPRYAAVLIAHLGWRHAYVCLGASAGAVILISSMLCVRNPPVGRRSANHEPVSGLLLREAVGTLRFWKIALTFALLTAILGGAAVTLPVVLRQRGVDAQAAASIMTVVGLAMFAGRLSLGVTLDRFFAPFVTIAVAAVALVGLAMMAFWASVPVTFAAAGCIGFGLGAEYAVTAYVVSRAFGIRAFGAIYGATTTATSIGAAIGPASFATAIVSTDHVAMPFAIGGALLLVPIGILGTLRSVDLPYHARPTGPSPASAFPTGDGAIFSDDGLSQTVRGFKG